MLDYSSYNDAAAEEPRGEVKFTSAGGRIPPHSLDAEQSVLGAILLDNEALTNVVELLTSVDFYQRSHQILYEVLLEMFERHEPIDIVTLAQALKAASKLDQAGGVEYLSHLVDIVPTAANTQYYARIIREMSIRRKMIHEASEIVNQAFLAKDDVDSFIDSVEQRIFKVSEQRVKPSFVKVGDLVKDSIKAVEARYVNSDSITGVPSGFIDLDELTSGFQPSDLIIVAGRPSMGKTSLALSMGRHVALDRNRAVAVFSLEMSKEQITMRLLCSEARVSNSRVRSGKLAETDFPRLVDAAAKLAQADIFIDDTPALSVLEMRAKARRLHRERALSLIIVDYLQLMRGSSRRSERREQEISEISGSLKAIAKELSVPVIALSQLNRGVETRTDKRPIMADLRESGAIEQDADLIGFVYRDEVYNPETPDKGIAELIVSKHRNGPVGTIRLRFEAEHTLFEDLTEESSYDYLGSEVTVGGELDDPIF
jgi:replicative DNA helicase